MKPRPTLSAISVAIQSAMSSLYQNRPLVDACKTKDFTIKIANTLIESETVFKLAYRLLNSRMKHPHFRGESVLIRTELVES